MSALLLHHHLGLGDHFICNGLVNHLAERHEVIYLPAKRKNYDTIRCLYSEEPVVRVFAVDDEFKDVAAFQQMANCPILRVGFEHCDPRCFDMSFYRQLGIDFAVRYSKFRLPRRIPREDDAYAALAVPGGYCIVHNEGSRGPYHLKIATDLPVVFITAERARKNELYRNLLNYRKLIQHAEEIHCINSSVIHLVDSLQPRARLFFHAVRKMDFSTRERWSVVEYSLPLVHDVLARARRIF